jgi:Uma2 family endonuclease
MVLAAPRKSLTFTDYVAGEKTSSVRHDFINGQAFAMAGGTPEHAALAASITVLLGAQLRGKPCRPYSSDLRIHIPSANVGAYPGVTVVCGELQRSSEDSASVLNPTLIVEVLSDSTEAYDRGDKFSYYRLMPSLQTYVLVSQRRPALERHVRNADGSWTMTVFGPGTRATLDSIACELIIDDVYEGIVLV